MHNLYNVPIIHQDLFTEATILHIANALDYLTNTVNDVFNKIDNRIEENCKRTAKIAERIDRANEKINKLVGSNKATIVYSSAKYPAGNVHKDPEATFKKDDGLKFKYDEKIVSKPLDYDEKMLGEKLHFFHVKSTSDFERNQYKPSRTQEGLGLIPNDIKSITSMLLYNTKENPYKHYVTSDPLNPLNKLGDISDRLNSEKQNESRMEDAPLSISNRLASVKQYNIADGYFYSPNLGDVPQIDVPLDLPDLPGIADDISFSLETGPTIAPSIATTPALLDLPEISTIMTFTNNSSSNLNSPTQISNSIQNSMTPNLIPDVISKDETKDIKTEIRIDKSTEIKSETISLKNDNSGIPPPPPLLPAPPPLPPSLLGAPPDISTGAPKSSTTSNISTGAPPEDRSSLMAAIRQAGGAGKAKLRAAKPVQKEPENKSKPIQSTGNNLMADLHAKLSMRRKGISGNISEQQNKNITENNSDIGVMDKISAMIPPPPKLEPKVNLESDDTDWES